MMTRGMSSINNCIKLFALTLVFQSMTVAYRDPINNLYESHKIDTRSVRHYCGNNLVRALHFLCESYNKRSSFDTHSNRLSEDISDIENDVISSDDGNESPKYSFAFVKLLNNKNDLKYFHRTIRGVVDECCRRSCSTSQLSQYCGVTRVTTTTGSSIID